jgi:soluble lytic murein transglycosylase-like protein
MAPQTQTASQTSGDWVDDILKTSSAPADTSDDSDPRKAMPGIAKQYGLDPDLVSRIIQQESGWNEQAESPKVARGLMQLMPATAQRHGVDDPFDPIQNMNGGMREFAQLQKKYGGDTSKALAAYNAGEEAVDRYNGIPPYQETQDYVKSITAGYKEPSRTAARSAGDASPPASKDWVDDLLNKPAPAAAPKPEPSFWDKTKQSIFGPSTALAFIPPAS